MASLAVVLEGVDLPGRTFDCHRGVHVGVQRKAEVVDVVPGDAPSATWAFDVTVKDGGADLGGPFVHGRKGDRFLYLSWGEVDGGAFTMFRRAKLHVADVPEATLAAALAAGVLRGRVRLTDACGEPRCARVRPPDVTWSAG